jgi:hypothetical protein
MHSPPEVSYHIKQHKQLPLCNLPPSPAWRFHEFVHRTYYIGWPPRLWTDHFLLTPFHTEPCPRPPPLIHVCSAFQWSPSSSKLLDTTKVSCNIQLASLPHPTMTIKIFRFESLSKLNNLQDVCTLQVALRKRLWCWPATTLVSRYKRIISSYTAASYIYTQGAIWKGLQHIQTHPVSFLITRGIILHIDTTLKEAEADPETVRASCFNLKRMISHETTDPSAGHGEQRKHIRYIQWKPMHHTIWVNPSNSGWKTSMPAM